MNAHCRTNSPHVFWSRKLTYVFGLQIDLMLRLGRVKY